MGLIARLCFGLKVLFCIDGLHRVQPVSAGLVIVIAFCPRFLVLVASSLINLILMRG